MEAKIKVWIKSRAAAAALFLLAAMPAAATPPTVAVPAGQQAFELFYGSNTNSGAGGGYAFYSMFNSSANPELGVFASYISSQVTAVANQESVRDSLLGYFQSISGGAAASRAHGREHYAVSALIYGLGRPAGVTTAPYNAYPLNLLPERTAEERGAFLTRLNALYGQFIDNMHSLEPARNWEGSRAATLSAPEFFQALSQDVRSVYNRNPVTQGWYAVVGLRDGETSPLVQLAPWAAGRPAPGAVRPNPFSPGPRPAPLITASASGNPVLDFSRIGTPGSGHVWRTVTQGGQAQRVLYAQGADGSGEVEVGRVWTQGGFSYLNYTGPGGNASSYGQVFPMGEGGAAPAGRVGALPPGVDYSRIQSMTVRNYLGQDSQVVLIPQADGRYEDLNGNQFETRTQNLQSYHACGRFGRRTCVSTTQQSTIVPVGGAQPPAVLPLVGGASAPGSAAATSGGSASAGSSAAGGFELVAQTSSAGSRRIVRRNGQEVGYVITIDGQDRIFLGSPTAAHWAIYQMNGQPVALNYTGRGFITRTFGGRSITLIPREDGSFVDVNGRRFTVNGQTASLRDL